MHESVRRSPRFFLSPPKSQQLSITLHDSNKTQKNSLTISDIDLDSFDNESHCTPQPLKVHHPKSKLLLLRSSSSVRRSPRFNGVQSGKCSSSTSSISSGSKKLELGLSSESAVNGKRKLDDLGNREDGLLSKKKLKSVLGNGEIMRRSPRFSGSKSETFVGIDVKLGKKGALKLIKSVECGLKSPSLLMAENLGKFEEDQVLRRSPRFSGPESETAGGIEVKLREKAALKLINSEKCEENEEELVMDSPSLLMAGNLGKVEEDKVLRRSPRGLPSSFPVVDECDEFEFGFSLKKTKKKSKKKAPKVSKEKSKVCGRREDCFFVGEPVLEEEALQKWGWRYQLK